MTRRRWGLLAIGIGLLLSASPLWGPRALEAAGRAALPPTPASLSALPLRPTARLAGNTSARPWQAAPRTAQPRIGHVAAMLKIPALGLNTPVIQGTSDSLLLLAPGHFSGSVLPGEDGTSVIAAHNATYFRHLASLRPGASIEVRTRQGVFWFRVQDAQVMPADSPVLNTPTPSLDLEACYPLDALYFTPNRYVVQAFLVKDQLRPGLAAPSVAATQLPRAQIAAWIRMRYPLSISQNSIPMGRLSYVAPASQAVFMVEQSPAPLNVERDGVHLWVAFADLAQADNLPGIRSLFLPGHPAVIPPPWRRASRVQFFGPLDVSLSLSGQGHIVSMRLSDQDVVINQQSFRLTLTAVPGPQGWAISAATLRLQS